MEALKDWGATFAVVKAANPMETNPRYGFAALQRMCRQHILVLAEGGLEVAVYCYLYFAADVEPQVAEAIRTVEYAASVGVDIKTVWLDVEDPDGGSSWNITHKLQEAVMQCVGSSLMPGVYTRRGFWRDRVADTHGFAQLALWDAAYGHPDPSDFAPYGGWGACAVRQYAGSTDIGGVNVDLNSRYV